MENNENKENNQSNEDITEDITKENKLKTLKDELNLRQQKFCELYASDKEFFGNGTESYIEAYYDEIDKTKPNWYKKASASATRLLKNVSICKYISELLTFEGFNDQNVDKQLNYVISQYGDLGSKIAAIREYNKLKKRVSDKLDLSGSVNFFRDESEKYK